MFVSCQKKNCVCSRFDQREYYKCHRQKHIERRIFLLVFKVFIFAQNMQAILYHFKHVIIIAIQTSREDTYISAQLHMDNCWSKKVLLRISIVTGISVA